MVARSVARVGTGGDVSEDRATGAGDRGSSAGGSTAAAFELVHPISALNRVQKLLDGSPRAPIVSHESLPTNECSEVKCYGIAGGLPLDSLDRLKRLSPLTE